MNKGAITFEQAMKILPKCLHRANDDSATLDDLLLCSRAEIDRYDADEDERDIRTKAQRRAAQRFVDTIARVLESPKSVKWSLG